MALVAIQGEFLDEVRDRLALLELSSRKTAPWARNDRSRREAYLQGMFSPEVQGSSLTWTNDHSVTRTLTAAYLQSLVQELLLLPDETGWVEFKENNEDPDEIGEYISALSNSAALLGKTQGYLLWGVKDDSREVVGTKFRPNKARVGQEELESWLLRLLTPKINFRFYLLTFDSRELVLLEIQVAHRHPVQFKGQEFIRVGSYKKKLKDFPEKERELWRIFDKTPFESGLAAEHLSEDEVLRLLDYVAYFDLTRAPLPQNRPKILESLQVEALIRQDESGQWGVTNLGAVLFARQLSDFGNLGRKALRIIRYAGNSRIETMRELTVVKGYASAFESLVNQITSQVPSVEIIEHSLRKEVGAYPELAIRELVANALIHQDFFLTGAGPMVEIFDHRLEVTNPGCPLVKADRFLDSPPRSRNEALASLMRRLNICEERGSGIDKVVSLTETHLLPAPLFEVVQESTRTTLFSQRPLTKMDKSDRVRACYLHACLRYVNRDYLTNASLRERFKIETQNSATASRIINEALQGGAIIPFDESSAKKLMKYVPYWVAEDVQVL